MKRALLSLTFIVVFAFSGSAQDSRLFTIEVKGRTGYIDNTGKIVIKPQFDEAWNFSEGLAPVRVDDKWGYIDETGKIVIAPQFFQVSSFNDGLACVGAFFKSAPVNHTVGNYGYIDKSAGFVIKPQFGVAFNTEVARRRPSNSASIQAQSPCHPNGYRQRRAKQKQVKNRHRHCKDRGLL